MIKRIVIGIIVVVVGCVGFSQGASLSPFDLKEQYLEKQAYFKKSNQKAITPNQQEELNRIHLVLKENAPNSYEFKLINAIHLNYSPLAEEELKKASALKPEALEINRYLFEYYCFSGNKQQQLVYAKKIKGLFSQHQLNYYKQVLAYPKATYFVFSGQEDALPVFYLQAIGAVSSSLQLINLDFLTNKTYRQKIQHKLGMSNTAFLNNETGFIANMLTSNQNICISTTVPQAYLQKIANEVFITGLSYTYRTENQYNELQQFWHTTKEKFNGLALNRQKDKQLYSNYLPPLLTLYTLKKQQGENDAVLKEGIKLLAKKIGKEAAVDDILSTL